MVSKKKAKHNQQRIKYQLTFDFPKLVLDHVAWFARKRKTPLCVVFDESFVRFGQGFAECFVSNLLKIVCPGVKYAADG
jgi:hypothetical protein